MSAGLSDEHFGFFLLAWVWLYLSIALIYYVFDLVRCLGALIEYLIFLPSFWHSVLGWWFRPSGRKAWYAASEALQKEEKAYEASLREQVQQAASKKNIPPEHVAASMELQQQLLQHVRAKSVRPESLRIASEALKVAELDVPRTSKRAAEALYLIQRSLLLAARFALVGIINKAFLYDPWAIIGVSKLATTREVERAFRQKSLTMHPDKGGDKKAFLSLQEAKNYIVANEVRSDELVGVNYALPKFMNNLYFVAALLAAIVLFPLTCICGITVLSVVFPLLFAGGHIALLWNLFCIQYRISLVTVVLIWACGHAIVIFPALLITIESCKVISARGVWSFLTPCGFFMIDWKESLAHRQGEQETKPTRPAIQQESSKESGKHGNKGGLGSTKPKKR